MFNRKQIFEGLGQETAFLWGPRQVGKSTLLRHAFPHSHYYDLLASDQFERFNQAPWTLREELTATQRLHHPIIIDEIQKIPALLDEVHLMMTQHKLSFMLCGSSARKLKQKGVNLLGGRALSYQLFPLVYLEIPNFDLIRALNHGLIPRHYLHANPKRLFQAYVGDYLQQEIAQEGLVRNLPSFGRFLKAAAFSNGAIPVFKNIAQDCGVSAPTAREYFQILKDTLIGDELPSFQRKMKRRVVSSPKFFFFDLGVANFLLKRQNIEIGSEIFGQAFEHFIWQELRAHRHYSGLYYDLSYWRTSSGQEVDFILGEGEVAIEIKGVSQVMPRHLKGLQAFSQEIKPKHSLVVSLDRVARKVGEVLILPWKIFLERLWSGDFLIGR